MGLLGISAAANLSASVSASVRLPDAGAIVDDVRDFAADTVDNASDCIEDALRGDGGCDDAKSGADACKDAPMEQKGGDACEPEPCEPIVDVEQACDIVRDAVACLSETSVRADLSVKLAARAGFSFC